MWVGNRYNTCSAQWDWEQMCQYVYGVLSRHVDNTCVSTLLKRSQNPTRNNPLCSQRRGQKSSASPMQHKFDGARSYSAYIIGSGTSESHHRVCSQLRLRHEHQIETRPRRKLVEQKATLSPTWCSLSASCLRFFHKQRFRFFSQVNISVERTRQKHSNPSEHPFLPKLLPFA